MKLFILLLSLYCCSSWSEDRPARSESNRKALENSGNRNAAIADPADFNLHFELLIIALPSDDALLIAEEMQDPATFEAAFAGLLRKTREAKAKVLGLATLITKSGHQAVTENIDEVRYPIEFAPPSVSEIGKTFVEKPAGEPQPHAPPSVAPVAKPGAVEMLASIPMTFETRNVGVTLQIEPKLDPAAMQLNLQIAAQRIVFKGMEKHTVTVADTTSIVEQPRFATNKVQTQLTLRSGNRALLGTFKAPDLDGWTELHILRATAHPLK